MSWTRNGVYLHTRLRTKTKVKTALVRDLLFADDTAFATHFEAALQRLITKLASACINFGLKISLKKTNVSAQDVSHAPEIKISDHTLVVVDEFTYLGSTVSMNSGLDSESPEESANTPAGMSKLTNRAWQNIYLTESTKKHIYQACVLMQYLALQQWNLDHLHETGTPLELFPSTIPSTVRYCHVLEPPVCTPYSFSSTCDGSKKDRLIAGYNLWECRSSGKHVIEY